MTDLGMKWAGRIAIAFQDWAEQEQKSRTVRISPFDPSPLIEGAFMEAGDAPAALDLLDRKGLERIDIVFTDVVLPKGMSGADLAEEVKRRRPGVPILFTTGYTRNAIVHNGILDANVNLINKPYTLAEVARKLRELLDSAALTATL